MQKAGRQLARAFLQELGIPQKKLTVFVTLGKQLLRSGTSVGANYREGHRGRSKAEFIAKLGDSLRELEETPTGWSFLLNPKYSPNHGLPKSWTKPINLQRSS